MRLSDRKVCQLSRAVVLAAGAALILGSYSFGSKAAQDCDQQLMEFKDKLERSDLDPVMRTQSFGAVLDSVALLCSNGQSQMALDALAGLSQSLSALEKQRFPPTPGPSPAEADRPRPTTKQPMSLQAALGAPRNDLKRFFGLYELPDGSGRRLFVAGARSNNPERPIPPGYLMIGAMWGDAGNWYMASRGDVVFQQAQVNPGAKPVTATFHVDEDDRSIAMSITSSFINYNAMERVGPLPADW